MRDPTCMSPWSTRCPPNHRTATLDTFRTSSTAGNIVAIQRPTVTATVVRSRLAARKRSTSYGSRTKERTTRIPLICSRRTRLRPSIRTCRTRKPGTMRETTRPTTRPSAGTQTASSQDSPRSSRTAMTTPPTIMIGADTIIVQDSRTSICTCCTSLVLRVMSDGAPKALTSWLEKEPTCAKMPARRSRPKPIAVRAPNHTAPTVQAICRTETRSMRTPVLRM